MNEESNIERQEIIRKYLQNQLNSEERLRFEQQLENNADLREEVALESSLLQAMNENDWDLADSNVEKNRMSELRTELRSEENKQLSQLVKEVGKEYVVEQKIRSSKRKWYGVVVACGIVIFSVFTYFMILQSNGMQQYYKEYANWNELLTAVEKNGSVNELVKGEVLYNEKKFDDAITYFMGLMTTAKEEDTPFILMYLGASYYQIKEYDKALKTFDQLTQSNTIESSRGYWYKLLIYLKLEQKDDVKRMITIISANRENYKYNQVQELKRRIN